MTTRRARSIVGAAIVAMAAIVIGACGGEETSSSTSKVREKIVLTERERATAPDIALSGASGVPVALGADRSLQSPTAEFGLHAVGDALGSYDGRPIAMGRAPDGRYLTRVEVHAVSVSRVPAAARPTASQRRAAAGLVRDTLATAHSYRKVGAAVAAGFVRVDESHYVDEAAVRDGRMLDPAHPEALMYVSGSGGTHLAGVMYLAEGLARGVQVGGPLTPWHYHLFGLPVCMLGGGFPVELAGASGTCARGVAQTRSPEMLHVWIDNPRGRFDPGMDAAMPGHDH